MVRKKHKVEPTTEHADGGAGASPDPFIYKSGAIMDLATILRRKSQRK